MSKGARGRISFTPMKSRPSSKIAKPAIKGIFGVSSQFAGIGRPVSDADATSAFTGLRAAPPGVLVGHGGHGAGKKPDEPTPPSGPTDPDFSSVVLLPPFTLVIDDDQSNSNHTLTAVGNAAIVSNLLDIDGSGDAVSAADSVDWDFGTGDFTMEAYVDSDTDKIASVLLATAPSNGVGGWIWQFGSNEGFSFYANGGFRIQKGGSTVLPASEGTSHLALTRASNILRLFKDGVKLNVDTSYIGTVDTTATAGLRIGNYTNEATFGVDGRMSGVRITKGVARWTADFTPPTLPLPTS